jgi:hypothetical protein
MKRSQSYLVILLKVLLILAMLLIVLAFIIDFETVLRNTHFINQIPLYPQSKIMIDINL